MRHNFSVVVTFGTLLLVGFLLTATGSPAVTAADSGTNGTVVSVEAPETVSPDESFEIVAQTTNSSGTIIEILPASGELNLSSSSGKIVGNQARFLDPTLGSSRHTVSVDYSNGQNATDITVNVWVNDAQQATADDTFTETVTVISPTTDFRVPSVMPRDQTITKGQTATISPTITNSGEVNGTQTVEFRLDTNGDDQLDASEGLLTQTVQLDSGERTTVEFNVDTSIDAVPNDSATYAYGVFSANDTAEGTLTIEPREQAPGPSDVTGNGQAPTDPDGDGLYEDVSGDGSVGFNDLTALYQAFSNGEIDTTNSQFFNFNEQGGVGFADITALYRLAR